MGIARYKLTIWVAPTGATPTAGAPTPWVCATSTPSPTATFTPTATATNTPAITPTNGFTYNRAAAVAYAEQWAHEPRNINYPLANETGCNCNDCTNYISQVLNNGTYQPRIGNQNKNDVAEWWYDPLELSNYSLTWAVTNWLKDYMELYNAEFDIYATFSALDTGDFILLDLLNNETGGGSPDGVPDHARVVVGHGITSINQIDYTNYGFLCIRYDEDIPPSSYTLLVNQHCVDRRHVAWDYNLPSNANKWYVHIK